MPAFLFPAVARSSVSGVACGCGRLAGACAVVMYGRAAVPRASCTAAGRPQEAGGHLGEPAAAGHRRAHRAAVAQQQGHARWVGAANAACSMCVCARACARMYRMTSHAITCACWARERLVRDDPLDASSCCHADGAHAAAGGVRSREGPAWALIQGGRLGPTPHAPSTRVGARPHRTAIHLCGTCRPLLYTLVCSRTVRLQPRGRACWAR